LGNPTATTQPSGNNSTRLATTAFVQQALRTLHPIGSIYINIDGTNPGTLLGFGTWVAFAVGKTLIGFDGSDTSFDTAEETGGSKDAVVVSHTHTATVTDAGHSHAMSGINGSFSGGPLAATDFDGSDVRNDTNVVTTGITVSNSTEGVSGVNANLPPYVVVYMWKRTL